METGRTAPDPATPAARRRARDARRVGLACLITFVGLGAFNVFGVRTEEQTAAGAGYELTVRYVAVTRPGLAATWQVEVRHEGGFTGPVELATTAAYFELFDYNAVQPSPVAETVAGEDLVWEFDPPTGDTLVVTFDGRIEPARQSGASATTAIIDGDRPVVSVGYRTTVLP